MVFDGDTMIELYADYPRACLKNMCASHICMCFEHVRRQYVLGPMWRDRHTRKKYSPYNVCRLSFVYDVLSSMIAARVTLGGAQTFRAAHSRVFRWWTSPGKARASKASTCRWRWGCRPAGSERERLRSPDLSRAALREWRASLKKDVHVQAHHHSKIAVRLIIHRAKDHLQTLSEKCFFLVYGGPVTLRRQTLSGDVL